MGEYQEDGDFDGLLASDSEEEAGSEDGRGDLLGLDDLAFAQVLPAHLL
jgi:hypothetical protein